MTVTATQSQHILNFDAPAAVRARGKGIERADLKCNPEWREEMLRVAKEVARRMPELTTDDIVKEYASDPDRPLTSNMRAMGGLMVTLRRLGIIEATGRIVKSERISNHQTNIVVYRSLVYRGAA